MRTTLDLDEDVLMAAREIARQRGVSIGKALSDSVVQGLLWHAELLLNPGS